MSVLFFLKNLFEEKNEKKLCKNIDLSSFLWQLKIQNINLLVHKPSKKVNQEQNISEWGIKIEPKKPHYFRVLWRYDQSRTRRSLPSRRFIPDCEKVLEPLRHLCVKCTDCRTNPAYPTTSSPLLGLVRPTTPSGPAHHMIQSGPLQAPAHHWVQSIPFLMLQ